MIRRLNDASGDKILKGKMATLRSHFLPRKVFKTEKRAGFLYAGAEEREDDARRVRWGRRVYRSRA